MSSLRSLETQLAELSQQERIEVLEALVAEGLSASELEYNWDYRGRPDQLEVTSAEEALVLFSIGRGGGKTHTGAEWVRKKIQTKPSNIEKLRFSFTSRTAADVRDVMINGDSGIMNIFPPSEQPEYISSQRLVKFHDGSEALMFSSIEPSQLRGPQFHYSWADEIAAWKHIPDDSGLTAWDNLQIGTRLGATPQILATTTPKRTQLIRKLYSRAEAGDGVKLVTGASTFDNPHLAAAYFNTLIALYGGTRLESQELYANLLADVEGALWKLAAIIAKRQVLPGRLPLRVVGVDPSVAENPTDECGIVVAGATNEINRLNRHGYVLADYSLLAPPSVWAQRVVEAAREYEAPVVAEVNNGGALVKEVIHGIDPTIRVLMVSARKGKALRAEPVVLAYDQGRVHHIEEFPLLEDQMTTWVPAETKDSPDRLDALVYALGSLVTHSSYLVGVGGSRAKTPRSQIATPSMLRQIASSRLQLPVGVDPYGGRSPWAR